MAVTSNEIAAYLPKVEKIAIHLTGRKNSEYDDLVQEGLVAVWVSLERGVDPANSFIRHRMINWINRSARDHAV